MMVEGRHVAEVHPMRVPGDKPRVVRFGVFEVDLQEAELRKSGIRVKLQEQPFRILTMLLDRPGQTVTREELRLRLWPADTFVDFDHGLNTNIKRLRQALGDDSGSPRFIETLHRRGYRFISPVEDSAVFNAAAEGAGEMSVLPVVAEASDRKRGIPRWAIGLCIAILFGIVAAIGYGFMRARREPPPRIESLLVLPLVNLSGDPQQEYFADGMTEELITSLGKVGSLRVISRTSAMHYKGTRKTLPEIARELGVDGVVEGAVLSTGTKVRVTAQLVRANPETHLWSESYEREGRDVLTLQSEIARTIVNEIEMNVTSAEKARLARARPVSPEAYEAYLMGRHFWGLNFGGLEYFQKATQLDPSFAPGYGGIALYYAVAGFSQPPSEVFPKAAAAATKALQLDPDLAEAHAALGYTKFNFDWDWTGAEREFRRAIELNPSSSDTHWMYAVYLTAMTRFDEANSEAKRARQLDPFSPFMNDLVGWVFMYARRYDDAIAQFKSTLKLVPGFRGSHAWLIACYANKGMYAETYREFRALGVAPDDPGLAVLDAVTGKREKAKVLEEIKRNAKYKREDPYFLAIHYSILGDKDDAFDGLERAYAERSAEMPQMKIEPAFDVLRSDPRFEDLLHRMNFPQ